MSKIKSSLSNYLMLVPLVYFIPPWVAQNISDNHLIVTLISLAVIVPLISFGLMPLLSRFSGANKQ
ncbi:hypothetical protein HR060_15705 [Catenovulum sp. SM1970]|uniref:hypothetical protein n=1 Tax=Marinifaba aquimaris TaxID=2741323 RepID=UPI001574DB72|nr:hypothetical protein [Marinifaba aquimaris]NTS78297.1 hypothetical protein [Marinifaba aquimaris]